MEANTMYTQAHENPMNIQMEKERKKERQTSAVVYHSLGSSECQDDNTVYNLHPF